MRRKLFAKPASKGARKHKFPIQNIHSATGLLALLRGAMTRYLMKTSTPPTETKPVPQLITPAALRQRWAVSNMFLWRARRDGRLPAVKLGKHVRFVLADVEKFEAELRS